MKQQKKDGMSLFSLALFVISVCGITGGAIYQYKHPVVKIKEVQVEVQKGITTIEVTHKFNLTGAEYTKKVMNNITVTSYNNIENQTDDTPNVTATSRPVREGMVAVSRDFLNKGWAHYGDLVYIDCFDKWFVVEDTMNQRFEKRMDVFLFDKKESLKINKKCGVEILHITK